MILPTRRLAFTIGLGGLLCLVALAFPSSSSWKAGNWVWIWNGAVLLFALTDVGRLPRRRWLVIHRSIPNRCEPFNQVPITLVIQNRSPRVLQVSLIDFPPVDCEVENRRMQVELAPLTSSILTYRIRPMRRGTFEFGPLTVGVRAPFDLIERRWSLKMNDQLRVVPSLAGALRLSEVALVDARNRPRPRGTMAGTDFRSLRSYSPGDDLRSVDWKASARRGSLVIRELQPERNQTLWLLIDCGRHSAGRLSDGRSKLDCSVTAALALAAVAVGQGDRVGLLVYSAEVHRVIAPVEARGRLQSLAAALGEVQPSLAASDIGVALETITSHQRRRALILIFTGLSDSEDNAMLIKRAAGLRPRHLTLLASVEDDVVVKAAYSTPSVTDEAYASLAAQQILSETELAVRLLRANGMETVHAPGQSLARQVVESYRLLKARGAIG